MRFFLKFATRIEYGMPFRVDLLSHETDQMLFPGYAFVCALGYLGTEG